MDVVNLISNLGFPIACVCAMFYMWNAEREAHQTEIKELQDAVENNTLAINTLTTLFESKHN